MLSPWFRESRPFRCRTPASCARHQLKGASLQLGGVPALPSSQRGSQPPAHPSSRGLPDGRRNISWRAVTGNVHSLKVKYRARKKVGDVVETPICVDEDVPGVPCVFQLGEQKAAILRASSYHPLCVSFDPFASKQVTQPFQSPPPQDKILFPSGSGSTRSESLLHPAGLSLNICKPLTWVFPNARGRRG